ncbi:MAG: class I adenylate-forming enzyme family protein [Actinomycetota bacterium]
MTDNIATSVQLGARTHPHRPALAVQGGAVRTYAELAERSARIAGALLSRGLIKGDRVAIWSDTRLDYLDVYIACAQAGLVVAPVNARFKGREASVILADSGAVALFYSADVEQYVDEACAGTDVRLRVSFDESREPASEAMDALLTGTESLQRIDAQGDDLFVLGYTSGTTGTPKGAMLTHRSVAHLGRSNALACRYVLGSVQVFGMSLSFSATVPAHILPHLYVGGTTVLLSRWDTERVIAAVQEHAATFLIVPSPVVAEFAQAVSRQPERVASLVSVLHSASKVPASDLEQLYRAIGAKLIEGWGMTENSGGLLTAISARDFQTSGRGVWTTVGRAVPGTEVAVLDEAGAPLPQDGRSVGQLVARSAALARGYWGRPEASAAAFRDGWYFTGDLGTIDDGGFIRIVDRRNDLINSGGMNIYPSELEQVLCQVAGVRDAVVVAVPHERWGQVPAAFVLAGDPRPRERDLEAYCHQMLAGFKRPAWIRVVDHFPLNASGKVLRHRLAKAVQLSAPDMAG